MADIPPMDDGSYVFLVHPETWSDLIPGQPRRPETRFLVKHEGLNHAARRKLAAQQRKERKEVK